MSPNCQKYKGQLVKSTYLFKSRNQSRGNQTPAMAARSIFLSLTRNCRGHNPLFGSLSSSIASRTQVLLEESRTPHDEEQIDENGEEDDLRSRIFRLRLPKRSATNVLQKWASEGRETTVSDLRHISGELRQSRRFKHALEISEWMVSHEEFKLSDSDYAVRIDLMTKVFGVDAAERYFEGLPPTLKTGETYTALLHSFAREKLVDKAEDLYERVKEANLSLSALTYNEMMTLYMSVGQVQKVPFVIEELKHQKVAPDLFTYNLWISSCAATMDINGVRRILEEMTGDSGSDEGWVRYTTLANIYITSGNLVNAEPDASSLVESEKGITQREWITYDFLIILYTGLGNKDKLDQIWKSLRMTKQKMTSRNYVCILSSYLVLGHLREAGEVVDQWKQSVATDFDDSTCNRLLKAFSDAGLIENGKTLRVLLNEKAALPIDESKQGHAWVSGDTRTIPLREIFMGFGFGGRDDTCDCNIHKSNTINCNFQTMVARNCCCLLLVSVLLDFEFRYSQLMIASLYCRSLFVFLLGF
ncbi:LOW QUALITY PROTEIN: pentatricopeptide repeat-containing protein At5g09450, mitochondrial-like [Actinidia eriantha]|uniref:LOW QUALITY PROTEIN: pentatricopeptide repeat-containing protein At5g09450, mitochondrial-like n=1 Tax=Actinidia eriantha TaxID=165200 RepID=UPI0025891604|nr:LOW QUALITY PROTEIN: pentatricopeptide repeat-containing protein At5g09450, mitochondrial-like [Actinidia eriantha]